MSEPTGCGLFAHRSRDLGRSIVDGDMAASEFFARIPGEGTTPTLMFIQVPEPKAVKNRVHLDLHADDRAAEVERLVGLGARIVHEKAEFGVEWTTLADPEGNEFCVAAH
jgi:predicted enzyme related to lactoylglutathione lyase